MSDESGVADDDATARAAADAAALARADQGLIPDEGDKAPDPKAVPEWCPEKFARRNEDGTFNGSLSAAALSEAHSGLETKFTQKQQDDKPDDKPVDTPAGDDDTSSGDDDSSDAPLTTPEMWASFTEEFNEKGELSTESRAIIHDLGIPDQMVDDYIAGQTARGDQYHQKTTGILGDNSDEQYDRLVDWASGSMSEAEAKVFNDAVTSGDITKAQVAIRDLKQQYIRVEGSYDGILLGGSASGSQAGAAAPFASRHEMSTAINDIRYNKDSAYRAEVEKRIGVTNL